MGFITTIFYDSVFVVTTLIDLHFAIEQHSYINITAILFYETLQSVVSTFTRTAQSLSVYIQICTFLSVCSHHSGMSPYKQNICLKIPPAPRYTCAPHFAPTSVSTFSPLSGAMCRDRRNSGRHPSFPV